MTSPAKRLPPDELPTVTPAAVVERPGEPPVFRYLRCTMLHSTIRSVSVFVIVSVVAYTLLDALRPGGTGSFPPDKDLPSSESPRERVTTTKDGGVAPQVPPLSPITKLTTPPIDEDVTLPPTPPVTKPKPPPSTPKPSSKKPKGTAVPPVAASQHNIYGGVGGFGTLLPQAEGDQKTNDDIVAEPKNAKRFPPLGDVLPCVDDSELDPVEQKKGNSASPIASTTKVAPLIYLPLGCHGDQPPVGMECDTTSCLLGTQLAKVARCGAKRVGSFLGDNFYPSGLKKKDDPRFETDLFVKFTRHRILRIPWWSTVGNHDNRPWTQLRTDHPYWKLPKFNYSSDVITAADGVTTMQLFFLDTHWGFNKNDMHMEGQSQWLDEALGQSTARWKILATHEPMYCFTDFTHLAGMIDHVSPVLIKHNVKLFVSAHAHSLQLHGARGGFYQLISAGGANNLHEQLRPNRPAGYYHLGRGGTAVLVHHDHLDIVGFDLNNRLVFSHRLPYGDGKLDPKEILPSHTAFEEGKTMWKATKDICEAWLPAIPAYCALEDKTKN